MEKKSNKTIRRNTVAAGRVTRTAAIVGVSERHVRYVLNGERENDKIMEVFMSLVEREREIDSSLAKEVARAVPFN